MSKNVFLLTRDLLFRSKLASVVSAGGGTVPRDPDACDLAVIELGSGGWEERLRALHGRGVPAVAFGPHVDAEALRRVRALGATAVPNSQVEHALRALLE